MLLLLLIVTLHAVDYCSSKGLSPQTNTTDDATDDHAHGVQYFRPAAAGCTLFRNIIS